MQVHMCGVRGSTPAPGTEFANVGGHTSCVAIAHDEEERPWLVLDAGTGLRRVSRLLDGVEFQGTLLLGHLHWDHMMGLPFFAAGDHPDARVRVLVPDQGVSAEELLTRAMGPPLFPITPGQLRGTWSFETYDEGVMELEGFDVLAREIPHKGGRTMGFRVSNGRSAIAYLSDHAPQVLGPGPDELGERHEAALALADGVDLLIHDAQYTAHELPQRFDWGHAAAEYAIELGEQAGAKRVLLFHHDPNRTDRQVAAMVRSLEGRRGVPVSAAVEGEVIHL